MKKRISLILLLSLIVIQTANANYIPPKYWPVVKAEYKLEHRPAHHYRIAGRLVLYAKCRGMGDYYKRAHIRFFNKFSCTAHHPFNFISFVYLKARNMFDYNIEVIGGIG
jgi:hypothetical protein